MARKKRKRKRNEHPVPTCPYCSTPAKWVDSAAVYGKNYGKIWLCANYPTCDSYVGCHNNSKQAKGSMANAELREWRKKAHAVFDPFWRSGDYSRSDAYYMLSAFLGIDISEAHIGMFDVHKCQQVVSGLREYERQNLPTPLVAEAADG